MKSAFRAGEALFEDLAGTGWIFETATQGGWIETGYFSSLVLPFSLALSTYKDSLDSYFTAVIESAEEGVTSTKIYSPFGHAPWHTNTDGSGSK